MRRAVLLTAAAVLLGGPTALAFFSGGYFDEARLIATLVAWALVLLVALVAPRPLPASWWGRVALGGLALIAAWTGASIAWAPLSGPATNDLVRLLLYVGVFVLAMAVLRDGATTRFVEPALALGALVVIGYGLAGRLLPGLIYLAHSLKAGDRLEQPITYWNAEGALAAVGFVLCARLAGTASRPAAVRVLAAAGSAPLGLGLYLSYSRGAIAACVVGLVVLLAAAPSWSQLRAVGIALAAGLTAASASAAFPGVASLEGGIDRREAEGAIMLVILVAVLAAAAYAQARTGRAERRERVRLGELEIARRLPAVAGVAVALAAAGLVIGGLGERGHEDELSRRQAGSRLTSVESRRYDYWRIGLRVLSRHPLRGAGAGGFRVAWLRERPVPERTLDVHSLPLEMAAELGAPGLLGLGLLVGGVGVAAARALRRRLLLAPGAGAAATVWFLHAAIDWDWEVPAVTLPALILAGALVGTSEEPAAAGPERVSESSARAPSPRLA